MEKVWGKVVVIKPDLLNGLNFLETISLFFYKAFFPSPPEVNFLIQRMLTSIL